MTDPIPSRRARLLRLFAAGLAGAMLTGCASLAPKTPEDAVRERAQARWDALLAGKFDEAYAYLSPGSRAVVSPQRFRSSIGAAAAWKSAKVHSVTCAQADRCKVTMLVSYAPMVRAREIGTIETSIDETWLLDQGQWWLPQGL